MKHLRLILMVLTAAIFSAATWADGIDPKVIIQKGGGSIPITLANPNPTFMATATMNSHCLTKTDACVFEVFQNQTGITLTSLTIQITDLKGFAFTCGDASQILFFSHCNSSDKNGFTDVFFSGGTGVAPATQQCVPDSVDRGLARFGKVNCDTDPDDFKFVGGEFGLLVDAAGAEAKDFNKQVVSGETITAPEPGVGLLVLFGILAFGLLKPVRRTV